MSGDPNYRFVTPFLRRDISDQDLRLLVHVEAVAESKDLELQRRSASKRRKNSLEQRPKLLVSMGINA